jgi:hypothetical protein
MSDRTTARVVGILFIIATVAGLLSYFFQQPVVDAADYLTKVSLDEQQVATGGSSNSGRASPLSQS